MVNGEEVMADFQFIGNRVSQFYLETNTINSKGQKITTGFEFDYNIKKAESSGNEHFGIIEFIVNGKAKAGRRNLFKFILKMEGAFVGNNEKLTMEHFRQMLELNGVVTLSQISRSFILSVTSQSGINPPVRIPMVNVLALKEKKQSESATD
ncbi:MAG: preprotein translocase subunit SecB [Clostridiaceae bacterium]|jgi:preprotein translocase subunit SecB|nr:preprotein translocase subunit SecB [Clostridiaceae bacterium]HPU45046.1 preprotein translocase subunit SecB [Thermoclostridium sp.]